ncbi:antirestriction protein ArdA [Cedecea sp. P7760]|uniref:antirestriction protein ArdA n=1 Tax=Cedecea sp. P7760 TaxID=2726983 RepID=UPI0015A0EBA2|nr:antirestriction protein ArdA [Cedecea sp. P7760]NWC63987.1 antirestriction protein ArdA [Cedecea sp. P7760]
MTTPAVYVGTYHKYNCGSIFGKWMKLTDFDGQDDFEEACRQLHKGEADPEFMFQDCEGIPSRFYSESSINWHFIEGYKQAVDEGQSDAFLAWADYSGRCDYAEFIGAYYSEADSEEDFAMSQVDDQGLLDQVPEPLRSYFDYEAYARDLFSSDFVFHDGFVFSNH